MKLSWVGGIIASVVAGLSIWALTHEGGVLNPPKQPEVAHSKPVILAAAAPDISLTTSSSIRGKFKVRNDGEVSARGCRLYWGSPDLRILARSSEEFYLQPGETTEIEVQSEAVKEPDKYTMDASISCEDNLSVKTEPDKRVFVNVSP